MANERTFSIVKPNAVNDNNIGNIISRFESEGLRLAASKFTTLSKEKAEGFYIEHKERPFFGSLVNFMTSGPVLLMVLEGENAVVRTREIMGATNQQKQPKGRLGSSMQSLLRKMPFMVQIPKLLQREKSPIFLKLMKLTQDIK